MKIKDFKNEIAGLCKKLMYKVSQSTGKLQVWSAWAEGALIKVEFGELGGKLQVNTTTAEGKNIGKVNETTPEEQASIEVVSLYEDRYANKHYRGTKEDAIALDKVCTIPRKVHNFKDHGHKLPEEVYFSVKLNGSRACILDGKLYSKTGRTEDIKVSHIKEAVSRLGNVYMDCEVYSHGLSLQRIRSAWLKPVKTDKEICDVANKRFCFKGKDRINIATVAINKLGYNPNEDAPKLSLYVFDIPVTDIPFKDRSKLIDQLEDKVADLGLEEAIKITTRYLISHEDIISQRDHWYEKGYEGGVVYSPEDMFEFGKRSYSCLKTKPRLDAEALVVNCTEDKSGQGVLHLEACTELNHTEFKAKMKGDADSRAFKVQQQFIGRWVTFSYEELSDSGKPTKPVVQETRLCNNAGQPLE